MWVVSTLVSIVHWSAGLGPAWCYEPLPALPAFAGKDVRQSPGKVHLALISEVKTYCIVLMSVDSLGL